MDRITVDQRWDEIEAQHHLLFRIIDDLQHALSDGHDRAILSELLARLCAYVVLHFTTEETLMAETEYPAIDEHREHHSGTRAEMFRLQAAHQGGDKSAASETLELMRHWARVHISDADRRFGEHIRASSIRREWQ